MSEFVNYNKRDVALPPGCKDLIDVLPPEAQRHHTLLVAALRRRLCPKLFGLWDRLGGTAQPAQGCATGGVTIDRLSGVPHHVAELLKSQSECSTLNLGFAGQQPSIVLLSERAVLTGVAIVSRGAESEDRICARFSSGETAVCYQLDAVTLEQLADLLLGIWYLLTPVLPSACEITTDLLRRVYGFTDESRVQFQYHEIGA